MQMTDDGAGTVTLTLTAAEQAVLAAVRARHGPDTLTTVLDGWLAGHRERLREETLAAARAGFQALPAERQAALVTELGLEAYAPIISTEGSL